MLRSVMQCFEAYVTISQFEMIKLLATVLLEKCNYVPFNTCATNNSVVNGHSR